MFQKKTYGKILQLKTTSDPWDKTTRIYLSVFQEQKTMLQEALIGDIMTLNLANFAWSTKNLVPKKGVPNLSTGSRYETT